MRAAVEFFLHKKPRHYLTGKGTATSPSTSVRSVSFLSLMVKCSAEASFETELHLLNPFLRLIQCFKIK